MAGHKLDRFTGIFPRMPDSLLPIGSASVAQNCDFAYGELRNTKDGMAFTTVPSNPASLYSEDGVAFYSWASDVNAVRSPLAVDIYNRLYYTDATVAGYNGASTSASKMKLASRIIPGGTTTSPPSPFDVGVPKPTAAPTFSVSIPDITGAGYTLVFKFHYESAGIKYEEQTLASPGFTGPVSKVWTLTLPALASEVEYSNLDAFPTEGTAGVIYKAADTGLRFTWLTTVYIAATTDATPVDAVPVVRLTATKGSVAVCDIYTANSSFKSTAGAYSITLAAKATGTDYTVTLADSIPEADKETRAYVYTYVNTFDEEGPPSPPATVDAGVGVGVWVACTIDSLGNYKPLKEIRIYRTPTGSTVAEYFLSTIITAPTNGSTAVAILDSTPAELLNDLMVSTNYYPPPDGLMGLMTLPNGILCGWKDASVWFSEAYKPWAWPPQYAIPLPHMIVNAIAHGSGAVVTTRQQPYLISGITPDSMTSTRLNVDQSGASKWAIAVVDGMCVYASNDGLVTLAGGQASLAGSEKFFTREIWRSRYGHWLSALRFAVWDGRLIVYAATQTYATVNAFPADSNHNPSGKTGIVYLSAATGLQYRWNGAYVLSPFTPFMIRLDEAAGSMTDLPSLAATCSYVSLLSDQLWFATGTSLCEFNGGLDQTAVWKSGEIVLPRPEHWAVLQAVFASGEWTIEITAKLSASPAVEKRGSYTAGGVGGWAVVVGAEDMVCTMVIPAATPQFPRTIRLPGGMISDRWSIKLSGKGRFRELRVAETGRELAKI